MAEQSERMSQPVSGGAADLRDVASQAAAEPAPSPAEERRLLELAGQGDGSARDRLFRAHARLVVRLAEARQDRGLDLGDLLQEGSLALIAAIAAASPGQAGEEGLAKQVETSVSRQLDEAIVQEESAVRERQRLVEDAEAYQRAEIDLHRLLGRAPTETELAEKLEWSAARTQRLAEMVEAARRRHDEELLEYLNPQELDLDGPADAKDGTHGA
jgi:DNA-directed RNA polymerase sigma subunit (sigma70/sigma32)